MSRRERDIGIDEGTYGGTVTIVDKRAVSRLIEAKIGDGRLRSRGCETGSSAKPGELIIEVVKIR